MTSILHSSAMGDINVTSEYSVSYVSLIKYPIGKCRISKLCQTPTFLMRSKNSSNLILLLGLLETKLVNVGFHSGVRKMAKSGLDDNRVSSRLQWKTRIERITIIIDRLYLIRGEWLKIWILGSTARNPRYKPSYEPRQAIENLLDFGHL